MTPLTEAFIFLGAIGLITLICVLIYDRRKDHLKNKK